MITSGWSVRSVGQEREIGIFFDETGPKEI